MHRFHNILFSPLACSDNPAATRRIGELAVRNAAKLTVFGALPEPSMLQRTLHRSDYLDTIRDAEHRAMIVKLDRCVPTDMDIEVETMTTSGSPALSIIEEVLRANHDLVIVTTDEDHEDQATINRLLRKSPCPVWVIRPTRARTQRVLAAVNPDPSETELNRTILEIATSVAMLDGGELHVTHAWQLYGEATMRHSAFLHTPASELEALLSEEEASRQNALDELLSSCDLTAEPWQIHLHKGRAARVITEVVRKHHINLLVMGTVARTGIGGLLIGNTAESVLDDVRCSVIAVKPQGFVTPIKLPETSSGSTIH